MSFTTVPSDVEADNLYTLVSEEVPDDEATYVVLNTTIISGAIVRFSFTVPEQFIVMRPCGLRVVFRCCVPGSAGSAGVELSVFEKNETDDTLTKMVLGTIPAINDSYDNYIIDIPADNIPYAWSILSKALVDNHEELQYILIARNGNKSTGVNLTQFYIEADFDIEENIAIYTKRNGSVVEVQQMYLKENGSWVELTVDEFKNLIQPTD